MPTGLTATFNATDSAQLAYSLVVSSTVALDLSGLASKIFALSVQVSDAAGNSMSLSNVRAVIAEGLPFVSADIPATVEGTPSLLDGVLRLPIGIDGIRGKFNFAPYVRSNWQLESISTIVTWRKRLDASFNALTDISGWKVEVYEPLSVGREGMVLSYSTQRFDSDFEIVLAYRILLRSHSLT